MSDSADARSTAGDWDELTTQLGEINRAQHVQLQRSQAKQQQTEVLRQLYRIADAVEHIEQLLSEAARGQPDGDTCSPASPDDHG